jgi:hypothetical protein
MAQQMGQLPLFGNAAASFLVRHAMGVLSKSIKSSPHHGSPKAGGG